MLLSHHESMARVLVTVFCAVPGPRRAGVQLRHVIRALMQQHSVDLLVVRDGDQSYVERQGNVRILRVPVAEVAAGGSSNNADSGPVQGFPDAEGFPKAAGNRSSAESSTAHIPDEQVRTTQIQSFQRALKRQLEGADYDVVHCVDSWTGMVGLEAKRRLGYALIYDLTRTPVGDGLADPNLEARNKRYEQACLRGADVVLAPTPIAVRALADRAGGRVVLSPPGVDVDRFDWEDPPSNGVPRILYAGSIDASRGVRVLIRAMAAIARDSTARLVVAGPVSSPAFASALDAQSRELGVADRIDLIGPIDHEQIPALLATATVCVVPEAADLVPHPAALFPSKLLEYLACRRAVVAARRDTVALVVKDQEEALLFDPGDPKDLARKVLRLLGDPALRDRIASAGYDRVRREFTASAARRALRGAYALFGDRVEPQASETPKAELIADDDFEATVIESATEVATHDTGLHPMTNLDVLDDALDASQPAMPARRAPTRLPTTKWPGPGHVSTRMAEESSVTHVGAASWPRDVTEDDGTPADGVMGGSALSNRDSAFVAGEIDVPVPTPRRLSAEFDEPADSDTGVTPARSRNS